MTSGPRSTVTASTLRVDDDSSRAVRAMTGPSAEITGIWLHCHEEDAPSSMVIRPRDYPLRPARWRDARELMVEKHHDAPAAGN